jgi:NO-binding membrane sensor protein with MHYT domain/two-component sensor histidine kinase
MALALFVAVFGSWTALDLFRRVRSHIGRARRAWLGLAAVAMGVSIWSMHFIAMLGFAPGAPVTYDPDLTLLSLALAVAATGGAFFAAARAPARRIAIPVAGAAMGAGICGMHYLGMAAVRTPVAITYDPVLVAASLLVAVTASTAALYAAQRERSRAWRATAAVILGFAISGMHYTAMAAMRISADHAVTAVAPSPPQYALAAGVAAGTLLILFLAIMAALYDQRLNVLEALEAGGVGYWELELPRMSLQVSPRGKALLSLAPDESYTATALLALLPPEAQARQATALEQAIATRGELDIDIRLPAAADEAAQWINVRGRVVGPAEAPARRMVGVMFDVTEREAAFAAVADSERRQRLLIDELNHRVKNTLAAVQSISRQSAKRAGSLEAFRDLFESRLIALSHTHNALTRTAWQHAGLRELLAEQLGPYPADQIRMEGAEVALVPREALALGMVFHELATNAAKYGALSTPSGLLHVAWEVASGPAGPELRLTWAETGGPPVVRPARRGFGSRMVQGSVAGELGGQAELTFDPEGFHCRLTVPLAAAAMAAA